MAALEDLPTKKCRECGQDVPVRNNRFIGHVDPDSEEGEECLGSRWPIR